MERLGEYAEANTFLTKLNNETLPQDEGEPMRDGESSWNRGGSGRLEGLDNLVAVMFDADRELFFFSLSLAITVIRLV